MNCTRCGIEQAAHVEPPTDALCTSFVAPETPGVEPPRIRIAWKQSTKGVLSFEVTWEGKGEYSQEERDTARNQALAESDILLAELVARSTVPQPTELGISAVSMGKETS